MAIAATLCAPSAANALFMPLAAGTCYFSGTCLDCAASPSLATATLVIPDGGGGMTLPTCPSSA